MFDKTTLMYSHKHTLQIYTVFSMFNSEMTLFHLKPFQYLNSHTITEQHIFMQG